MKEETRHTGECEGRQSPQHLYPRNPSRISPRSLLALSAEVWDRDRNGDRQRGRGRERGRDRESENARREKKKGETAQCARGSRDIVTPLHPFADAFRSHRNLGCSSLFLASRACENSSVQDAIRARGVVEDVQETSYRANYLRLTTLPVRSVQNSSCLPQNRFVPTIC